MNFELVNIECYDVFKKELKEIGIEDIFFYKKIFKKEDFLIDFNLKNSNSSKIFLLEDINLVNFAPSNSLLVFKAEKSSDLFLAIKNKKIKAIVHPIGNDLIFDEASANLLKENNKPVIFNFSEFKKNTYKSIKQSQFIIDLLLKKQIPFFFLSFAEKKNDVIQPIILENFLKNFNLNAEFIKKQMQKETFEKTCLNKK
jgi:hypothetical protein